MALAPFHLAIPVYDLEISREFYGNILGLPQGRTDEHWTDYNFYGHQLVIHYKAKENTNSIHHGAVDGHQVPVPHFGIVLEYADWEALAERVKAANIKFVIEPYIRFKGETGEQATMFFLDPCGNALEFKSFKDISQLFAT